MLVKNRMSTDLVTISPEDNYRAAKELIEKNHIHHLLVTEGGELVGIITDRDIREAGPSDATSLEIHEMKGLLEKLKVKEIMTKDVVTVTPDTPLKEAAEKLYNGGFHSLPVMEGKKPIGIITSTDFLKVLIDIL
ncbi:MAG: CBS domain-containing protein [Nitrospinota bacterium]